MSLQEADCIVVGAGVIGLAVAAALARAGREVVVVERERVIGSGVSSRNSEVIHAGIYYPEGSLKARLCVSGKERLYAYCAERGVAHRRCGKLIAATRPDEEEALERIAAAAARNGVVDVERLSAAQARALEPELACVGALLSPSTGIVDTHGLMLALQGEAEDHGAAIAFGERVVGGRVTPSGVELAFATAEPMRARLVVNAAGLAAPGLARLIDGFAAEHAPEARFAKGSYFMLMQATPFSRLVYPAPEPGGLGVHFTLDLAGQGRFGPDVEWVEAPDYEVDPARGAQFYDRVRRYWPGLKDGALAPGYAGVRPKISGPGEPAADFVISGPADHGAPGLVNLFGVESPGLTSSLAIAAEVARIAAET